MFPKAYDTSFPKILKKNGNQFFPKSMDDKGYSNIIEQKAKNAHGSDKPGEPGKPADMINILKSQGEPGKDGENFKNSSRHRGVREVFLIKLINLFFGCFFWSLSLKCVCYVFCLTDYYLYLTSSLTSWLLVC